MWPSARFDPSDPLVFNHIPKTAGTSLRAAIGNAFPEWRVVAGFDRSNFGNFTAFDSIEPSRRQSIFLDADEIPRNVDFLAGHLAPSTTRAVLPNGQHLTVLREGRTRILSHWMYWRNFTDDMLVPWGGWGELVRRSRRRLQSFLTDDELAGQLDNLATRILLWPHELIPKRGRIRREADDQLVLDAIAVLSHFAFVDVVENPSLARNLETWFDRPMHLGNDNETRTAPEGLRVSLEKELTPGAHHELNELSRLDNRIWTHIADAVMADGSAASLADRSFAAAIDRHGGISAA